MWYLRYFFFERLFLRLRSAYIYMFLNFGDGFTIRHFPIHFVQMVKIKNLLFLIKLLRFTSMKNYIVRSRFTLRFLTYARIQSYFKNPNAFARGVDYEFIPMQFDLHCLCLFVLTLPTKRQWIIFLSVFINCFGLHSIIGLILLNFNRS